MPYTHIAFMSYRTQTINGQMAEGMMYESVSAGDLAVEVYESMLEELKVKYEAGVTPTNFNILPATVGGVTP